MLRRRGGCSRGAGAGGGVGGPRRGGSRAGGGKVAGLQEAEDSTHVVWQGLGATWWLRSRRLHSIARGWVARRLWWRLLRGEGSVRGSDVRVRTGDVGGSAAGEQGRTMSDRPE
jgi:hypothetical protein